MKSYETFTEGFADGGEDMAPTRFELDDFVGSKEVVVDFGEVDDDVRLQLMTACNVGGVQSVDWLEGGSMSINFQGEADYETMENIMTRLSDVGFSPDTILDTEGE